MDRDGSLLLHAPAGISADALAAWAWSKRGWVFRKLAEKHLLWPASTSNSAGVPFDINHAGGTTTVTRDQQANGGQWVSLGTYNFNAGQTGNVLIRTTGRVQVSNDVQSDDRLRPWHALAATTDIHTCAALPLMRRGRAGGVLLFFIREAGWLDEQGLELMGRISENISFGLEMFEHEGRVWLHSRQLG